MDIYTYAYTYKYIYNKNICKNRPIIWMGEGRGIGKGFNGGKEMEKSYNVKN